MAAVTRMFKNYLYSHGYFTARKITKIGLQDQLNTCKCRKLKEASWINCSLYRVNSSLDSVIQRTSGNGRKNVIVFSEARNAYLPNNKTPERSFNKCDVYFWLSRFLCALLYLSPIVRCKWFNFKHLLREPESGGMRPRDEAKADLQHFFIRRGYT